MKTIAIINSKGGCGKSTSCFNLATAKALMGKKVLMVDCDPQGTITDFCDIDKESEIFDKYSLSRIFVPYKRKIETAKCIYKVEISDEKFSKKYPNIDGKLFVLPSDSSLQVSADNVSSIGKSRETLLKRILKEVENDYDYCFIDSPGNTGILSINAIMASDGVIFPTEAEDSNMEGVYQMLAEIDALDESEIMDKKDLTLYGVLITRAHMNTNYQKRMLTDIKEDFSVLGIVRNATDVPKYQTEHHIAVVLGNSKCNVAKDYMAIAEKI